MKRKKLLWKKNNSKQKLPESEEKCAKNQCDQIKAAKIIKKRKKSLSFYHMQKKWVRKLLYYNSSEFLKKLNIKPTKFINY